MGKEIKEILAVLGPAGTHSEAAAEYLNRLRGDKYALREYGEIYDVLAATEAGAVDAALVPVENSLEGQINITLDTLAAGNNLYVTGELIWPVHNFLMGKGGDISRIYSHPQPISQCRNFLRAHFPYVETVKVASTARAAELAAAEEGAAAICPRKAGELNNLKILYSSIEDNDANCTRFFEVRRNAVQCEGDKTLVICRIDGRKAGSLLLVLEEFAKRGVNLTRIESRPARTRLGEYIFFFDVESNTEEKSRLDAIEAVKRRSLWLRNLGTFPVFCAEEGICR